MRLRMKKEFLHLNLHVLEISALSIVSCLPEDLNEQFLYKLQVGQKASFLSLLSTFGGNL